MALQWALFSWSIQEKNNVLLFCTFFSQKLSMPVGYLDSTYINPIYDWGWLQPTGGMFSTADDMAKVKCFSCFTPKITEDEVLN